MLVCCRVCEATGPVFHCSKCDRYVCQRCLIAGGHPDCPKESALTIDLPSNPISNPDTAFLLVSRIGAVLEQIERTRKRASAAHSSLRRALAMDRREDAYAYLRVATIELNAAYHEAKETERKMRESLDRYGKWVEDEREEEA